MTPKEAEGITMCVYAVVADLDAHHAHAVAAGAEIIVAPHDNEGYPGAAMMRETPRAMCGVLGPTIPYAPPVDA